MADGFYSKKERDEKYGIDLIVLGYKNAEKPEQSIEAYIAPAYGDNLCKLTYSKYSVIAYEPENLVKHGFVGTPILYPTPNRVLNGKYSFDGKEYEQIKIGKLISIHGLVHSEKWESGEPEQTADGLSLETWLDVVKGSPVYGAFPFEHRIAVTFTLSKTQVDIRYTVTNKDPKDLPFGFALHTYFSKLSGDTGTKVSVPADAIMDVTDGYFPTDKVKKVAGTAYDLRKPVELGKLNLDTEYLEIDKGANAYVTYDGYDFRLRVSATDDFAHLVMWTPPGKEFFCIENQTCSINGHNFYSAGYKELSGLIVVPQNGKAMGCITYGIDTLN
jgi:aldose 1-epimerase